MTNDLQRRLEQQNYTSADEVIEEVDLDKAADLEKELNLKYGYPWNDSQDYRIVSKLRVGMGCNIPIKDRIKGAKKVGRQNVSSGHLAKIRKIGGRASRLKANNIEHKCPHCSKIGKGPAMFRYHFDKCKEKK